MIGLQCGLWCGVSVKVGAEQPLETLGYHWGWTILLRLGTFGHHRPALGWKGQVTVKKMRFGARTRRLRGYLRRRVVGADRKGWERYYLDGRSTPPRDDVIRLSQYSPVRDLAYVYPGDSSITTMHFLPRFTYMLENVVVDPLPGVVYDSTVGIIPESSAWALSHQQMSWPQPRVVGPPPRQLPSSRNAVFLTGGKFSGFYHWLLEDLPVALASLEVADDPVILVPEDRCSYVDDVLGILGIPIVELRRPCRIPRLVMTGKVAGIGSPYGVASPHPADVELLRRFFGRFILPRDPASKLVVSRSGYRRSAANESELIEALTTDGFRVVDPAQMSLVEQIEQFSAASALTGIHGAAHSNCVWMAPGARVEELLSHTYVSGYFAALSACIGADYRAHIFAGDGWDIDPEVLRSATASALETVRL